MNHTRQLNMGARPDYATPILALLKDRPKINSGEIAEAIKGEPEKVRKAISNLLGNKTVTAINTPKKGNFGYRRVYMLNPDYVPTKPTARTIANRKPAANPLFTVWNSK